MMGSGKDVREVEEEDQNNRKEYIRFLEDL